MSKALNAQNTLQSALHGFKDRAAQVKEAHRRERQAIKEDPMISDLARRQKQDALAQDTRNKLAALKAEQDTYVRNLRDNAERDLRGKQASDPASVLSRRDAADRVRKITDRNEALDILNDAIRNGDHDMAHAIGTRGRMTGMLIVGQTYQEAYPDTADAAEALAFIEGTTSGPAYNVSNSMTFGFPAN